jgi:hypothetical protein
MNLNTSIVKVVSTSVLLLSLNTHSESLTPDNIVEKTKNYVTNLFNNAKDQAVNDFEKDVVRQTDFTHLEISVGQDIFDLGGSATKTKIEAVGVYRLHENDNTFIFNQTSLVDYNDRRTINLGLGAREINDDETVIYGGNIFYDYELDSNHDRVGLGLEYITSVGEVRFNKYKALSKLKNYKTIDETALDGHDFDIRYNLPYLYSSSIFYNKGKWEDGVGYEVKTKQWGLKAEPIPNLHLSVALQKQNSNTDKTVSSLSYVIPFGKQQVNKTMQDGVFTTKLQNIRKAIYKPVKRENRIMKKSVKLGVKASGY